MNLWFLIRNLVFTQLCEDNWKKNMEKAQVLHHNYHVLIFFYLNQIDRNCSVCFSSRIFGFVAKKSQSDTENVCHLFAEHDPEQPASAIVNFVSKVMIGSHKKWKDKEDTHIPSIWKHKNERLDILICCRMNAACTAGCGHQMAPSSNLYRLTAGNDLQVCSWSFWSK